VRLAVVLGLLVGGALSTALAPVALKRAVDALTRPGTRARGGVAVWIAAYVLGLGLARGLGQVRAFVYARAERRLFRRMSERLFAHVLRLPLAFHLARETGAVSQTLDNGLQGCELLLRHLSTAIVPAAIELCTVLVVLAALRQPPLVVLFSLAIAAYAGVFGASATRISRAARSAAAARVAASAVMTDGILNAETVKLLGAESSVGERVERALLGAESGWVDFARRFAGSGLAVAALFVAFLTVALTNSAHEALSGRLTVGGFVLVSAYLLQLVRPVEMLGFALQGLSQGVGLLGKLVELLREPEERDEPAALARAPRFSGELEFSHVTFSYGGDRPVLDDISFRVPAGHTLGIVGASGAGKSTILRLLVRLLEPDGGAIRLDGISITELPLSELRAAVAVVPQEAGLLNDTIGRNIALARSGCTCEEVEAAARAASLDEWVRTLPKGYGSWVGERGAKLSGGERQRVAIARAALRRPAVYAFDEATSSLDGLTERRILASLEEIAGSRTALVIAHRLSAVVHADEILVLRGGRVVERGRHPELLAAGGVYATLWRAQSPPGATAAAPAAARRC
jgi:ABC-type multidrug transport system fused ATPase/permease subunit